MGIFINFFFLKKDEEERKDTHAHTMEEEEKKIPPTAKDSSSFEELVFSYTPKQLALLQNRVTIYKVPSHSIPNALKLPPPIKKPLPGPSPLSSRTTNSTTLLPPPLLQS